MIQLKDEHGQMQHKQAQISQIFMRYYENFLGNTGGPNKKESRRIFELGSRLKKAHRIQLLLPVTPLEIKKSLWSINIDKSADFYRYRGYFLRIDWDIICTDIYDAIQEFFHNGEMLQQLNATMM